MLGFQFSWEIKKPRSLFGEQGLENFIRELDDFLLLAGGSLNKREPITATVARYDNDASVVSHRN
jgi:hypothetical protein